MISESVNKTQEESSYRLHLSGPDGRKELALNDRRMTFGANENCQVRIDDRSNQIHFVILRGKNGAAIRCCSGKATLNGQAFQDAWLTPGDRIRCGEFCCEFVDARSARTSARKTERRSTQERRASVKRRTRTLVQAIRESRGRIRQLELELNQLEVEFAGSQEELEIREEREQRLQEQQQQLEAKLQQLQIELDRHQAESNRTLEVSNQNTANQVVRKQIIRKRTRSLVDEIRRTREQIRESEAQANELNARIADLQEELSLRQRREDVFCSQKDELTETVRELNEELTQLRAANVAQSQIWSTHHHRLRELFPAIELTVDSRFTQEHSESVLRQIESIASTQAEVERTSAAKKDVLDRCRAELDEKFQELSTQQEDLAAEVEALDSVKSQIQAEKEEIAAKREQLESDRSDLETQISEFEVQVSATQTELEDAQAALEQRASQSDDGCSPEQADELRQRCVELAEQLHETLLERNDLRDKVDELIKQEIQNNDWEVDQTTDKVASDSSESFSHLDEMEIEAVDDDQWSNDSAYLKEEDWQSDQPNDSFNGRPYSDSPEFFGEASVHDEEAVGSEFVDEQPSALSDFAEVPGFDDRPRMIEDTNASTPANRGIDSSELDYTDRPVNESSPEANSPHHSSMDAEEIEFSSVSSDAPMDTASILANYGVDLSGADDEVADVSESTVSPNGLETASPNSMSTSPNGDPSGASDSDDSIQEYMAQLMNRVGGAGTPDFGVAPSYEEPVSPVAESIVPVVESEPEEPLRPEEYVPKSKQPEIDVSAIRSVANESARTHIEKHSSKSRKRDVLQSLCGAACCFLAGTSLLFWWSFGNLTRVGAVVCFLIGLLWIAKPFIVTSAAFHDFKSRFFHKTRTENKKNVTNRKEKENIAES